MADDGVLLQRYARERDAEAFAGMGKAAGGGCASTANRSAYVRIPYLSAIVATAALMAAAYGGEVNAPAPPVEGPGAKGAEKAEGGEAVKKPDDAKTQGVQDPAAANARRVLLQPVVDAYDQVVKARRSMNHARTELVCRAALLQAQGAKDVTYEDLVMVAGRGTSFVFHPKKYWLIFRPPEDPKLIEDRLAQWSGWRWEELGNFKKKPEDAWRALVGSLDAGHGAVGAFLDDYILAGYQDAPKCEDRKVYHLSGWEPNGWWTWAEFQKWCEDWGRLSAYTTEVPRGDVKTILLATMQDAVNFAPGDRRKTVPQFAEGAYGLPGMEVYAQAVADTAKDPDEFDGGWLGCFCINRQHYAREAAAHWFRAKADLLPAHAREHLLAASTHYVAACGAWTEFEGTLGRGTGKTDLKDLKGIWRVPAARKAGAEAVRKAAECERLAVAEIALALAALGGEQPTAQVKREGGRVFIEGVDRLRWGGSTSATFIGALATAAKALGDPVTEEYLLGVSGAAFRLQFAQPDWCPSSPAAECGRAYTNVALRGIGYATDNFVGRPISGAPEAPEQRAKVRAAIVASINAGRPVLASNLIESPDFGLIVGYAGDGNQLLCRTYFDQTPEYSTAANWPFLIYAIHEQGKRPDRRAVAVEALERAIQLAHTASYDQYANGFAAYETWAANLRDESRFKDADQPKLDKMCHANGWCYENLVCARKGAVAYLRDIGREFTGETAAHLARAATFYEQVVGKLTVGWKHAAMPWDLKRQGKPWTQEMRSVEAAVLLEALAVERQAVAELEQALATLK